jgi:DNA segregation ATPase FtsK/SpoIIIE-like protein
VSAVKRYRLFANLRPEAIAFLPDEVVSASDYDALAAELDRKSVVIGGYIAAYQRLQDERDQLRAAISTPESVFVNMKAGKIAKPALRSMLDLYGEVTNSDEAQLLEISRLKAEVERLGCVLEVTEDTLKVIRGCLRGAEGDIDKLKDEVVALRKEAASEPDTYRAVLHALRRAAGGERFGISRVQRTFLLGYNSAARLVGQMARRGDIVPSGEEGWAYEFPDAAITQEARDDN